MRMTAQRAVGQGEAIQARTGGPRGRAVTTSTRAGGNGAATTTAMAAGRTSSDGATGVGITSEPLVQPVQPGQCTQALAEWSDGSGTAGAGAASVAVEQKSAWVGKPEAGECACALEGVAASSGSRIAARAILATRWRKERRPNIGGILLEAAAVSMGKGHQRDPRMRRSADERYLVDGCALRVLPYLRTRQHAGFETATMVRH
jgi:hypothetical protein